MKKIVALALLVGCGGGGDGGGETPVAASIRVSDIHGTGATVEWTGGDLEFGTTTMTGGRAELTGLSPFTTYPLRVGAATASFTTLADPAAVYPIPNVALPPVGQSFTDPVFGTQILRVGPGTIAYSYWPSFNCTTTRLHTSIALYDFDPDAFAISNAQPLFEGGPAVGWEDSIWSAVDPDVLYAHEGLRLWAHDVETNAWTLLKQFSYPGEYLWQMSRSIDDDVFAFARRSSSTYAYVGYVVWRKSTDSILLSVNTSQIDEVQVDKSGQWLVVKTGQSGAGVIEVKVVNLSTGAVENLTDNGPDFSPGHSDNGSGIVVGADNWNNRVTFRSLATPHAHVPVLDLYGDWSQDYHVSMLADDEGWVLLSLYGNTSPGLFHSEIVQVSTDGSKKIRRLAHHRSVFGDYYDSPRANISRDGRFVAFTSNWQGGGREVFVLRLPD